MRLIWALVPLPPAIEPTVRFCIKSSRVPALVPKVMDEVLVPKEVLVLALTTPPPMVVLPT